MAAMFLLSIGLWPRTSTWLDWGLAFGLFLLLPGYLPSLLLFPKGQLDGFQRVALSFPMSLGIALVPTLIVLATRSTLPTLGLLLFLVNLLLFLLVLKRWSPGPRSPMRSQPHLLHTLAIAVVIFVAVWVTWVGIQDGPIDGDDWRYLTRIRHYQDSPHLDDKRSYGIEQATVNPRQYYSIWLPLMAFLSKTTQIEADVVWLEYLRLTLVILGVLSFYTLARSILGSSVAGAFACAVQILYVLSEISRHEGIGRLFFIRLPQDKVLDWLVILPICFFALLHYLETKDRRFWVVFALSTLALSNISIIGIVLIGIPSASFIFVRVFLEERDKAAFQSYLLVGIVLLLSMVLPLISRGVLGEVSGSAYRREFRLLALSDRLYISNPDLLCNLFTLAALVLSPLLIIEVRAKGLRTTFPVGRCRDGNTSFRENSFISAKTAAQFLLVATFSSVLLVFNPLVAPILGRHLQVRGLMTE